MMFEMLISREKFFSVSVVHQHTSLSVINIPAYPAYPLAPAKPTDKSFSDIVSYVWWPEIDQDLEEEVKHCRQCQANQASPAWVPLHPWEWPDRP